MKRFNVICKNDQLSFQLKTKIEEALKSDYVLDQDNPDYCFTIGGDGTLLYAVHKYIDKLEHIEFIGIHTGTLGFFSDYRAENIDECIEDFKTKKGQVQSYNLLKAQTDTNRTFYAVNEIRIEALARAQLIDIFINNTYFETFRGNGILVCTQLGSTAYNRSIGGAIIDQNIPCIEMQEIAGINHQKYPSCNSPIIFCQNTIIKLCNKHFNNVSLLYDQYEIRLENEKEVTLMMSGKVLKILRFKDIPYLTRIKSLF